MTFIACAGTTVYVARTDSPVIEKYSITVQDKGTATLSLPRKYTVDPSLQNVRIEEHKTGDERPYTKVFKPLGIAARSTEPNILFVLSEGQHIVYKLDFTHESPTAEAYLSRKDGVNMTDYDKTQHEYTGPPFITCMKDNTLQVFLGEFLGKALRVRAKNKCELITIPFQSYSSEFSMNKVMHMYNHGDQLYGLYENGFNPAIIIDNEDKTWTVINAKSVYAKSVLDMAINSKGEIFVIHHTRMPSPPMLQMNISQVFAHGSKLVTVYSENHVHSAVLALFEHDGITKFLIYTRNGELRMVGKASLDSFTTTLDLQIQAAQQTVQNHQAIDPVQMNPGDRLIRRTELERALKALEQHQEELELMLASS